jgi:hypothetical protein
MHVAILNRQKVMVCHVSSLDIEGNKVLFRGLAGSAEEDVLNMRKQVVATGTLKSKMGRDDFC